MNLPVRRSSRRDVGLADMIERIFAPDAWTGWSAGSESALCCPVDVMENQKEIKLTAELPGLKREDVTVQLDGTMLTIAGEKKSETSAGGEEEGYRSVERRYGRFSRSFTLPAAIQMDGIKADFKDGVLEVTIPKKPEAQPRKIEIAAGPPPK
jgi:HSP20 family protein